MEIDEKERKDKFDETMKVFQTPASFGLVRPAQYRALANRDMDMLTSGNVISQYFKNTTPKNREHYIDALKASFDRTKMDPEWSTDVSEQALRRISGMIGTVEGLQHQYKFYTKHVQPLQTKLSVLAEIWAGLDKRATAIMKQIRPGRKPRHSTSFEESDRPTKGFKGSGARDITGQGLTHLKGLKRDVNLTHTALALVKRNLSRASKRTLTRALKLYKKAARHSEDPEIHEVHDHVAALKGQRRTVTFKSHALRI